MSQLEWQALIAGLNESVIVTHIGKPKLTTFVNGRLQGEDPVERGLNALRAAMPQVTAWWMQNRGINVQLQICNPACTLHFAILDAPPPMQPAPGQHQQEQQQQQQQQQQQTTGVQAAMPAANEMCRAEGQEGTSPVAAPGTAWST